MPAQKEKIFLHSLNLIPELTFEKKQKLLDKFGSFEKAWQAKSQELEDLFIRSKENLNKFLSIRDKIDPKDEFKKLGSREILFILKDEEEYPQELRETPWPPLGLYVKGNISRESGVRFKCAIVGTRRTTAYGKDMAAKFSEALSKAGVIVVSGLAMGIDAAAHSGTLNSSTPTWAILGSGVGKIYPKANLYLAKNILRQGGAIISEYPPDWEAREWNFPERNRIVAGLSRLTIVVEAPEKSGALITARLALEAGREVGVVPSDLTRESAKGSNKLMREGAHPLLSPEDALYILGLAPEAQIPRLDNLDEIDEAILQCLSEPKSGEEILAETKLKPEIISVKLMELELKNIISQRSGEWARKI